MQLQTWRALGTDWLLDQWGRWARVPDETRIGWPSAANFVKFMGGSIKTPEIDLDVALEVDRAVKMSSLVNQDYETVLVCRYVKQQNQLSLARSLHANRRAAVETLHRAEAWVDGYLHNVFDNLEGVA